MALRDIFVLIVLVLLTASCKESRKRVYIMQNPETMEFKNCDVGLVGMEEDFLKNEQCVKDLQDKGWIVWGSR